MVPLKKSPRQSILALLWCAVAMPAVQGRSADAPPDSVAGVAHPALWPRSHSVGLLDAATESLLSDLMSRMSPEEKVGQIIQADAGHITPEELRRYPLGAVLAGGDSAPAGGADRSPAAWLALTRALRAVAKIPILFGSDAVHGNGAVRGATIFPHNIGLGAAHDPALVGRIGVATAQEMAVVGFNWAFAPSLSVPQDLRWGRSYESYSQDPALVRRYASEMVRGLQGPAQDSQRVQSGHVAATAKHFLGDGGTGDGVNEGDTAASESELIRVHAQGYLSAIDAGVMTVMVSFSSWQGRKLHANDSLLRDVLK